MIRPEATIPQMRDRNTRRVAKPSTKTNKGGHKDKIVFLHSVEEGPASQSYGLQVAQLAGIPYEVIHSAKQKLAELEKTSPNTAEVATQLSLLPPETISNPAISALKKLQPDALTPMEALQKLYELKKMV